MTNKITPASNVFFNPLPLRSIAKYLEPQELGNLFTTSKQFFPLVTDTVSSLSLEQRRDFFSSPHTRFFTRKIRQAVTDKQIPPDQQAENISWLLQCTSPNKRRPLMDQASTLIDKADISAVPTILNHLTAKLMPEKVNLIDNLELRSKSNAPHIDSAQCALFEHLRRYFEHSKRLDSASMLEYWIRCTVAAPINVHQRIKDYVSFVSSTKMPTPLKEQVVELYSYVLGSWGGADNAITEKMLDEIKCTLDKGGITLEIKKQILCNLLSAQILSTRSSNFYEKIQNIIGKLIPEVETLLSKKERGKILIFLISNIHFHDRNLGHVLNQIDYFSQKEIALEDFELSISSFIIRVYYYLNNDLDRIKALDILENWISKPMPFELERNLFYSILGLKRRDEFISLHENIDKILNKISPIQIIKFYFFDFILTRFVSKILTQLQEYLLVIYNTCFKK